MVRRLRKIDDEVWKRIPYADKHYEISDYGRVKSFCYDKVDGRIVKPGVINGFSTVSLVSNGKKKTFFVHKITAELFLEKTSDDQVVVIHKDWNNSNNLASNLEWVTKAFSYKRMHKRMQENRKNSKDKFISYSKLTAADVMHIKSMLNRKMTQSVIAKLFCVSEMQISRIKSGENWSHIKFPDEVAS